MILYVTAGSTARFIAVAAAVLSTTIVARALRLRAALRQGDVFFAVFTFFGKIGDVEEGIAFEANVDEGRLHAGKDAGDAAFVDGASEGVFVLAFVIDFRQTIVFDECQPGFMRGAGE